MSIQKGYKANFETLRRAFANGDAALVECQDKKTRKKVIVIAAIGRENGDYVISPLAKMFDGNPYEELNPPDPENPKGFVDTDKETA